MNKRRSRSVFLKGRCSEYGGRIRTGDAADDNIAPGHREATEQSGAGDQAEIAALRTVHRRAERHERDRAQRRARPVEAGRQHRRSEIVEGGVGDEDAAEEQPEEAGHVAEEDEQRRRLAFRVEERHDQGCADPQQQGHGGDVEPRNGEAVRQHGPDAIEGAGAVVLAHDRTDRARQREQHAESDGGDAVHDREGGDDAVAEAGEHVHRVDVGDRRRDVGENRRPGDGGERAPVEPQGGEPGPCDEVVDPHRAVPADRQQAEPRGDQHDRRAVDAEVQAEDEDRIEAGGDDGAGERRVHRALGVADAAQDRREGHADAQEHRGRQDHAQVGRAHRERLAARARTGRGWRA